MKVLVACASDWTAPARLPRVLRRAGLEVHALTAPHHAIARTRYVDRVHEAPDAMEGYLERLRALAPDFDWVVLVDDPLLGALAARREEPWVRALLPMQGRWAAALASKAAFCRLGQEAGLPIAPAAICRTVEDARAAVGELGLPLILKQSAGFAGLGVKLVNHERELEAAFLALASDGDVVVAQRFIEGPIGNTVALYHRGRPCCWMSAYKVRTWPGPFGPSSARRFMNHPQIAPMLERLGALTGYHGFCALDWVHAPVEDRLHLIELNARPVPTIHMGPRAGVDFSKAVRDLMNGKQTVQAPPDPPADGPVVPMFPEDIYRASSEGALSLPLGDVPWSDPPLLAHHLRLMWRAAHPKVGTAPLRTAT